MQTVWMGLGLPSLASADTEALAGLEPYSAPVVLSDSPSVVTRVTLPTGTRQVWLSTPLERVWYALDALPGPIPPPLQGGVLPATIFAPGAILLPGQWQALSMDSAMAHELSLVSDTMSPTVFLTVWMEIA
jgi:hypothetical protein